MYTTQANIEARLGSTLTAEQVSYFNDVLDGAIDSFITFQTGVSFGATAEVDVYVDGSDSNMMIIPTMHDIIAVSRVTDSGDEEVIPVNEYRVYPQGSPITYGIRKLNGEWEEGFENYIITGKLGYALVPADIIELATQMAVSSLNAPIGNYKSEKVGDWAVTYGDSQSGITEQMNTTFANYRRLSRSI